MTVVTMQISKSQFKARALEYFREIESSGEPVIITDHGQPTLEVRIYSPVEADPKALLKGSVTRYTDPTLPVDDDAWEAAQ
jgi:antitoxin (DNA-binding transcriptional repressor) of toxin-antitoxin stability system